MTLLILGASTRAAAFSALRAGFRPVCADLFADHDLAAACPVHRIDPGRYPEDLARVAVEAPTGPWLYTGAIENHPDLIEQITARRPLWGNAAATVRAVRDPSAVAEVLRRAGVSGPEVRPGAEGLPRDGSWLVKPLASGGGLGIEPLKASSGPPSRPSYYQERGEGPSLSALYLGHRSGARLAGVTLQEVGRPGAPFAYLGSVGPWPVGPIVEGRLERLGATLAASFGLAGLFGVDFLLRDGQPWPVEVNPRYTASVEVLELALGRPLLAEHGRVFEPGLPTPASRPGLGHVGKRVLFATRGLRFPEGDLGPPPGRDPFRLPRLGDIPRPGTIFEAGMPVLTVFARGTSPESCRLRLERKASAWTRRLFGTGVTTP